MKKVLLCLNKKRNMLELNSRSRHYLACSLSQKYNRKVDSRVQCTMGKIRGYPDNRTSLTVAPPGIQNGKIVHWLLLFQSGSQSVGCTCSSGFPRVERSYVLYLLFVLKNWRIKHL